MMNVTSWGPNIRLNAEKRTLSPTASKAYSKAGIDVFPTCQTIVSLCASHIEWIDLLAAMNELNCESESQFFQMRTTISGGIDRREFVAMVVNLLQKCSRGRFRTGVEDSKGNEYPGDV